MNMIKGLLTISVFIAIGVFAQGKVQKTKLVAIKEPSVMMAMDIKNNISVPLTALEKKD